MSTHDVTPGRPDPQPGKPVRPEQPPSALEQIIGLITDVVSDWDRTLRLALLVSVVLLPVTLLVAAAVLGVAQVVADPGLWWEPALCAAGVYLVVGLRRLAVRRARKRGPHRH